jgi:hypothetical protein
VSKGVPELAFGAGRVGKLGHSRRDTPLKGAVDQIQNLEFSFG